MIRAYQESYLNKAQKTLAAMVDYAVSDLNYYPDEFFMLFSQSGLEDEFGIICRTIRCRGIHSSIIGIFDV